MTATDTYGTTPWLRGASRWPLMPVKYLLAQRITDGPHETPEFVDAGYPFLSVDGIQDGELQFEGCRFVSEDQHREFRRKAAPRRGDVLFGKAASTGKIARVKTDIEFSIWSPLALLRPSEIKVTSGFLEYALKSQIAQGQIDVLVTTNTQNNISMDAIPRIRIPLPVLPQQRAIADYLDRETARLDALVVAKERVLGLLAEKRRALITRAVTRGVGHHTPLKDTGAEWLRQVPHHWTSTKIGRLFRQVKRQGFPDLTVLSIYREYGVIERASRDDNANRVPDDLEKYQLVEVNDLAINKMKAWQGSLGVAAMRGITSPDYVVFRPLHREDPRFLHFLLRNQLLTTVYLSMSNGIRTSQWRLEPDRFVDLRVFLPPLQELACDRRVYRCRVDEARCSSLGDRTDD